ncbi:MAG: glutamate synthase large subunit [Elusimicrobia bacterium]|nr:glutamate synthase large subunit [Elusimicrobiota bacterium]MBK8423417.1 glutamate synthase large subunit [Elusimicrobiota bacterium]MBK8650312.1 glutamate synthase large subunit [Elusimicrobiota bacterium]
MNAAPPQQGLYDPENEHDACGIGFVVNIKGVRSHAIVKQALEVLNNLNHRGAAGCEANTGDGAGILIQLPHAFLKKAAAAEKISLPDPGAYGLGMMFFPRDEKLRRDAEAAFEKIVAEEGQTFLGWRTVPTNNGALGATAQAGEPLHRMAFIGRAAPLSDPLAFERKLYVIRKRAEHTIKIPETNGSNRFYIPSLSARTVVFKGMLLADQMEGYFHDLNDPDLDSALALVHSRFSTNTFPNWNRAHPYRYIIHNGEINTLRGNINWMHARQALLESPVFGDDLKRLLPVVDTDGSDSAMFDNCLEFLVLAGRSLPHAMMMMIPEPWANHESMSEEKKAFYEFHSCLMEPWDGPASIAFTDGTVVGATLDRNGLRPSRYVVTKDDVVVLASEVGVLEFPPERVLEKGRLQPGRMLLIDTAQGRIIADDEIKKKIAAERPYREWLDKNLIALDDLVDQDKPVYEEHGTVLQRQQAFGYAYEDLRVILEPMAKNGVEPIGAMGTDTPLAVLSDKPQLLYNYFKQLFAQVTNPPIDCIREEIVTSAVTTLGAERNLLDPSPESCRLIELKSPILTNEQLEKLRNVKVPGFRAVTLPILFDPLGGGAALKKAMDDLCATADKAAKDGVNLLILSDRGVSQTKAPIPALLAVAGLHHDMIRRGTRMKVGLVLESGEPREVHHYALLIGYGVGAVNPYLAYETLDDMIREGMLDVDHKTAIKNYIKACTKGVVKAISKMGISTIQSYGGAQIFEAVGLGREVIDAYFTWTPSRIAGANLDVIAQEAAQRHHRAYPSIATDGKALDAGGNYQWRKDGEQHLFNPESIHRLQSAARNNDYATYKSYAQLINDQSKKHFTLRGLLDFKPADKPIPIDEVESVEAILKRFKSGAMSYGSISQEAHESLAIAMNRIGGKSNTGEGGEDPERYKPLPNGDSKNSAIKQVASGRFGVTSLYLVNAREIQIKMAQGAKPGEGGQLPGTKVYPWVAKTRHTTAGVGLISPPPHHDIYSIEDLAELIHDLKNANHNARISVKLVSEVGVGTIAAGVAKAHADVVLISGFDGGTGASPQSSIKHAGLPWELGLAETHQTLVLNNLRSRIVVETDGQLKTGRDVVVAAFLGAEEFGFATAPLVTLGCVMMRVCHLNTCPVGVATQDPKLRKKFTGDPSHVVNFMRFVAQEVRETMAQLGFRTMNEMIGRVDRLEARRAVDHWKAKGLDLSSVLHAPSVGPEVGRYAQILQDHGLDKSLDRTTLLELAKPALERGEKVKATVPIKNRNRVVGTILGSEVTRRYGGKGLPDDTIELTFQGSAGQSFGAFVPRGVTMILDGDANDYFGKGLSGGKLIVYPPRGVPFVPEKNIIIGNVAFYGATSGEAYIRGLAGERFAVRNSGVHAVVEGVGDHGCEYMTGGRIVVLGPTGRNFAAGMTGGVAYVWDVEGDFAKKVNREMVETEPMTEEDIQEVHGLLVKHLLYTTSTVAKRVLEKGPSLIGRFVKVMPKDYKRMVATIKKMHDAGMSGDQAIMAAFEENARDLSRVGGN